VLAIFGSTPCWASSASSTVKAGCTASMGDWAKYPTSSGPALRAAAQELGRRWGGRLAGVEYWNEPNNSSFFAAGVNAYVGLLKVFYPAIKTVAPTLTVIGGDLSMADTTFLQACTTPVLGATTTPFPCTPISWSWGAQQRPVIPHWHGPGPRSRTPSLPACRPSGRSCFATLTRPLHLDHRVRFLGLHRHVEVVCVG